MSEIIQVDILDEAKDCFLEYAKEVLEDRAIPASEDGLLRVHREIIWTMEEVLKMNAKSKFKKSASIVGSTLSTSYFHGDSSCYGAMCKLSLPYLMRYPLLIGEGSLGTQEQNDMQSASRYTSAKPSPIADLMMENFKKNAVDTKLTYNDEYYEPVLLPSLFPNAMCNGRQAIGVSMSHNSAPNNLREVCNAIIKYIENEHKISIDEVMECIPGPDFPLENTVINKDDIKQAFLTGKSSKSLKIRGEYEIDGNKIIFNTIPYRVVRAAIREDIQKNIEELEKYIEDFNDESNIGQNRLIFTVKDGIDINRALNAIFRYTSLQSTFSYNMNFIVNGSPKLCSMMDLIESYVNHQNNVIIRVAQFDYDKAAKRVHILEGLIKAVASIDDIIKLIKSSSNSTEARTKLISKYKFTEEQAKAILDMKLAKLTKLDSVELNEELEDKQSIMENCYKLINNQKDRDIHLIEKIKEMSIKYGDARRTKLTQIHETKEEKAKIEIIPKECVVIVTENNFIKRVPSESYKVQKRNTVGIKNSNDLTHFIVKTNTLDYLLVFTDKAKMYKVSVNDIPEGTNSSKGVSVNSLINVAEKPIAYTSLQHDNKFKYVFFATEKGIVKKVPLEEYTNVKKKNGVIALSVREGDTLSAVTFINNEDILLITEKGKVIKFASSDLPISSRTAQGVKGMSVNEDDKILFCLPITALKDYLALVSQQGYCKKVNLNEFTLQNRGGKGVNSYTDIVVGALLINDEDNLLVSGDKSSIRISATEIPLLTKTALGNIIIKNNKEVRAVSKI